ncbi:MAG: SDR family oxidoreductase [Planctomycetota bacterium]
MNGILITGAAGNVGARLAAEYLARTDREVFALVRAESPARARERVGEALDFWGWPEDRRAGRVTALAGDVETPGLGLPPETIARVRERASIVVHAAANIRLDQSLEAARRAIVGGTENALALARSLAKLERFGFVSTMEVAAGCDCLVKEEFLAGLRIRFLNTYEIAKFEAEEFLRGEIARGAPVTVFRPSMVVGEAATGKVHGFQSFYLLMEKMLLSPEFPVMPRGCFVDTIPVDVLAEGILRLMDHPGAAGRVHHFAQGIEDHVGFREFVALTAPLLAERLGSPVVPPRFAPPGLFSVLLAAMAPFAWGRPRRRIRIMRIFTRVLAAHARFETRQTRDTLASLGVAWPRFQECLPRLLDYYLPRRGRTRMPF